MTIEEMIDHLGPEDLRDLLDEVKQMRADLDAIKVQRNAVVAAIEEVDALQEDVASRAKKIKHHLKDAI